jgi:hypothetical protein
MSAASLAPLVAWRLRLGGIHMGKHIMTVTLSTSKRQLLVCHRQASKDLVVVKKQLERSADDQALLKDVIFLGRLIRITHPSFVRGASADQIGTIWDAINLLSENRLN